MSSFLNISDQGDMEVAGTVKANAFIGDGSQLTGIESGKWSDGEGGIFYDGGNVAVGAPADHGKLVVRGDAGVSRLTEDEEAPVIANFIASSQQQKQGQLLVLGTDFPTPHSVALSSIQAQNSGLSFATRDADNNIGARLTITGAGNVGIGTTNPQAPLMVENSAGAEADGSKVLELRAWHQAGEAEGSGVRIDFTDSSVGNLTCQIRTRHESTPAKVGLSFHTLDGTLRESVRILGNGNVGIGTHEPGARLGVAGSVKAEAFLLPDGSPATSKWTEGGNGIVYDGDVGIGGSHHYGKLFVLGHQGTLDISRDNEATVIAHLVDRTDTNRGGQLYVMGTDFPGSNSIALTSGQSPNSGLAFATRAGNKTDVRMAITGEEGNVGIGTAAGRSGPFPFGDGWGKLVVSGDSGTLEMAEDGAVAQIAHFVAGTEGNMGQLIVGSTNVPAPDSIALVSTQHPNSGLVLAARAAEGINGARVTITGAGNVGIGTAEPRRGKLEIRDVQDFYGISTTTDGQGRGIEILTPDFEYATTGSVLELAPDRDGNTPSYLQARIDGKSNVGVLALNPWGGNVGVGTKNPTAKLEVVGTIKATGLAISGPLSFPGNELVLAGIPVARTAPEDADLETVLVDRKTGKLYLQ